MGLAVMLIPLIPPLVEGLMSIVGAIRDNGDTPDELRAHLDAIWTDLQTISEKVRNAPLP